MFKNAKTIQFISLLCVPIMQLVATAVIAADSGHSQAGQSSQNVKNVNLRGFGRVSATGKLWKTESAKLSLVTFNCENPKKATILASKYVADMLAYGAVKRSPCLPGIPGTVISVRHGGEWLVALNGSKVMVASAPTRETLTDAVKNWGGKKWQAVLEHAYPRWLDCFDNAACGITWRDLLKSNEQINWMKKSPAVACYRYLFFDAQSPAYGVLDLNTFKHTATQIKQTGKPYRFLDFLSTTGANGWMNWFQQPGPQVASPQPGLSRDFNSRSGYYAHQLASPPVNAVLMSQMLETMRKVGADSDLMCWWEPHGELQYKYSELVPPNASERYREFLRNEKKYTLPTISLAYTGNPDAYKSWAEIQYPEAAYFNGRRGAFLDLDNHSWHWKPGTKSKGLQKGWEQTDFNDSDWASNKRCSARLVGVNDGPLWFRFSRDCSDFLIKIKSGQKIYLHLLLPNSTRNPEPVVWLNGKPAKWRKVKAAGGKRENMEAEISGMLHPGINRFAIAVEGGYGCNALAYRVFLSTLPDTGFPSPDAGLTRRYLDWKEYHIREMFDSVKAFVKAKRAVDPDRPILMAVPYAILPESFYRFAEEYGLVPYLTGEGAYYRPHNYKGYSSLRRLPSGSEPGGPAKDAKKMQYMAACIFWESQDCFNYFHEFRDIWNRPDVLKWWNDNQVLLSTMGKTDFGPPRLGELRDFRQDRLYGRTEIWKWDMARGVLPALGLTPVLIDGPDFEEGAADHIPVIVDDGTIVMAPPMVEALKRYIRNGGIFIAQHHTGQHSEARGNSWPLAAAFGLHCAPHKRDEEIRFTEQESLLPSLRGQTCSGSGVSIDYRGKEESGAIAIRGLNQGITPVANWTDDGSMAIAEVKYGKGRLIVLGSPFYLRFKDTEGKWLNVAARQKLVAEMLASLGVKRETGVNDERVWFERRESKNGLYDVYVACAMGVKNRKWNLNDRIESELLIHGKVLYSIIEATREGCPDVKANTTSTGTCIGKQSFAPYQVKQFAVLRNDVGLTGPLDWLETQRRFWRRLKPVEPGIVKKVTAEAAQVAASQGEVGMNINPDWKTRFDPMDKKDIFWTTAPLLSLKEPEWKSGGIGSWPTAGFPDDTRVAQYRKTIKIPATWTQRKVFFGTNRSYQMRSGDKVTFWVDGVKRIASTGGIFTVDVTKEAKRGELELAMQVEKHKPTDRGPVFTTYLRGLPKPLATIPLNGKWTRLENWEHDGTPVKLPMTGKEGRIFGLRTQVDVPQKWAAHPIRLIIDYAPKSTLIQGVIFNDEDYCSETDWNIGMRVDRWLKPGRTNDLILMPYGHRARRNYKGAEHLYINSIRLEIYPEVKNQIKNNI